MFLHEPFRKTTIRPKESKFSHHALVACNVVGSPKPTPVPCAQSVFAFSVPTQPSKGLTAPYDIQTNASRGMLFVAAGVDSLRVFNYVRGVFPL